MKTFVGIYFFTKNGQEWQVVPNSWLHNDNKLCHWPVHGNVEEMAEHLVAPAKGWSVWAVKEVCLFSNSYRHAVERMTSGCSSSSESECLKSSRKLYSPASPLIPPSSPPLNSPASPLNQPASPLHTDLNYARLASSCRSSQKNGLKNSKAFLAPRTMFPQEMPAKKRMFPETQKHIEKTMMRQNANTDSSDSETDNSLVPIIPSGEFQPLQLNAASCYHDTVPLWAKDLVKKQLENNLLLKENNDLLKQVRDLLNSKGDRKETLHHMMPGRAETPAELEELVNFPNISNKLIGEADVTLSKTITRMLRALMAPSLATQYSLTGLGNLRQRTKLQFSTTTAYRLIHSSVLRLEEFNGTSRKDFNTTVGSCLKNAVDWTGRKRKSSSASVSNSTDSVTEIQEGGTMDITLLQQ